MSGTTPRDLEIQHLAELANLPLSDDEADTLQSGCEEVLEAFHVPQHEDPPEQDAHDAAFEDEPRPWPEDEVDLILEQAPDVDDGRHIHG